MSTRRGRRHPPAGRPTCEPAPPADRRASATEQALVPSPPKAACAAKARASAEKVLLAPAHVSKEHVPPVQQPSANWGARRTPAFAGANARPTANAYPKRCVTTPAEHVFQQAFTRWNNAKQLVAGRSYWRRLGPGRRLGGPLRTATGKRHQQRNRRPLLHDLAGQRPTIYVRGGGRHPHPRQRDTE